ncbi:MAG: NUDIX hydrolase [Myxococcales bacterium]|nr:NUDIX hydrolase [Myxococcales bacterium]
MKRPTPPGGPVIHTEARFTLRRHALPVRGGGHQARAYLDHPGAVTILPLTDDGVLFIENRRWVVGQTLLELPAGGLEPGEDPAAAAARELEEETGHRAATLELLQAFYLVPAYSTEVMHAFVARGLTPTAQRLEVDEELAPVALRWAEIDARLRAGGIVDMKTLAVLGRWRAR